MYGGLVITCENHAGIADELVELVRKNDELATNADKVPTLTAKLLQTESRLDSVMQMYVTTAFSSLDFAELRSIAFVHSIRSLFVAREPCQFVLLAPCEGRRCEFSSFPQWYAYVVNAAAETDHLSRACGQNRRETWQVRRKGRGSV